MRFLSWFITPPILVVAVIFALQNRDIVTLSFWPFDIQVTAPLSFLTLGLFFFGIILGVLLLGPSVLRLRFQKMVLAKKVKKLTGKLESEKAEKTEVPKPTILNQEHYQVLSDTAERKMK